MQEVPVNITSFSLLSSLSPHPVRLELHLTKTHSLSSLSTGSLNKQAGVRLHLWGHLSGTCGELHSPVSLFCVFHNQHQTTHCLLLLINYSLCVLINMKDFPWRDPAAMVPFKTTLDSFVAFSPWLQLVSCAEWMSDLHRKYLHSPCPASPSVCLCPAS